MSNFSNNNNNTASLNNNNNQLHPKPLLPSLSHIHHFNGSKGHDQHDQHSSTNNGISSPLLLKGSISQKHVLPSLPPPPDSPSGVHHNRANEPGSEIKLPPISFFNDISRHSESQLLNKQANANNSQIINQDQGSYDDNNTDQNPTPMLSSDPTGMLPRLTSIETIASHSQGSSSPMVNNGIKSSSASPQIKSPLTLPTSLSFPLGSSFPTAPGSASTSSPPVPIGNSSVNTSSSHNNNSIDMRKGKDNINSISLPSIQNSLAGLRGYQVGANSDVDKITNNNNSTNQFNTSQLLQQHQQQQQQTSFVQHRSLGNLLHNAKDENPDNGIDIVNVQDAKNIIRENAKNTSNSVNANDKQLKKPKEKDNLKKTTADIKPAKRKAKKAANLSGSLQNIQGKHFGETITTSKTPDTATQKPARKKKRKNAANNNPVETTTPSVKQKSQNQKPVYHHDAMMINRNEQNGTRMIIHQHHVNLKNLDGQNYPIENSPDEHPIINHSNQVAINNSPSAVNGMSTVPVYTYVKPTIVIHNDDVLQFALGFNRTRLTEVKYELNDTQEVLNDEYIYYNESGKRKGNDKYSFFLLPELRDKINCILPIYISKKYLLFIRKNKGADVVKNLQRVRKLWGTDVYTDDSDIISILMHCGFIQQGDKRAEVANGNNKGILDDAMIIVADGNQSVKNHQLINGEHDVRVELLILPTLQRYYGLYRNGINSREWITEHDGVSISLYSVNVLK